MPVYGLIADTHGLLRPAALAALAGVDRILHAGDVGSYEIVSALSVIAPVDVVRGNNDPAGSWPEDLALDLAGLRVLLVHDVGRPPRLHPAILRRAAELGATVIVHGHSHQPADREVAGLRLINPGSAGPRRFRLRPSLARLRVEGGSAAELGFLYLDEPPPSGDPAR